MVGSPPPLWQRVQPKMSAGHEKELVKHPEELFMVINVPDSMPFEAQSNGTSGLRKTDACCTTLRITWDGTTNRTSPASTMDFSNDEARRDIVEMESLEGIEHVTSLFHLGILSAERFQSHTHVPLEPNAVR